MVEKDKVMSKGIFNSQKIKKLKNLAKSRNLANLTKSQNACTINSRTKRFLTSKT